MSGQAFPDNLVAKCRSTQRVADDNRNIHDLFNGFRRISRPSLGIVHRIKTRAGAFLYALADVKCGNACRLQYLRHLDGLVKAPGRPLPIRLPNNAR